MASPEVHGLENVVPYGTHRMSLPLIDQQRSSAIRDEQMRRAILLLAAVMVTITTMFALGLQLITSNGISLVLERDIVFPPVVNTNRTISAACNDFAKASVASNAATCAAIGRDMLMRNGSAVDAAIATLLCEELFEPESMGIGGGFYMTVYDRKSGNASVIDAREVAPFAAFREMYKSEMASQKGPLSIAVPGQVRGMQLAHQLWGRLPWKDLFAPTIRLCRQGAPVPGSMAKVMTYKKALIYQDPGLRSVFVDPTTGELYKQNDTLKRPLLGRTLEIIAEEGADAFYKGRLAKLIVDDIQKLGGILTREDFANYTAQLKDAIEVTLSDGVRLFTPPPPASGIVLSHVLLILDGYRENVAERHDGHQSGPSLLTYHRMIEAFKYAYAQRALLGDEAFVDMSALIENMTSIELANHTRSLIRDNRTFPSDHYGQEFAQVADHGTSHVSVVSEDGDAVSVTSTINLWFGSGILSQSTGIIFNDEMDDFSSPNMTNYFGLPAASKNFIAPGKRPVSSMCSSIFVDPQGDVRLVTGAAGGTRIITATAFTAILNLWLDEKLPDSLDMPRLHHQLYPPTVQYEKNFPQNIIDGLVKIGHNVTMSESSSAVNTIRRRKDGRLCACADGRKGGDVSGY